MAAKNIFKIEVEDLDSTDEAYSSGKSTGKKRSSHHPKITKISAENANHKPSPKAKEVFEEKLASTAEAIKPKNILDDIKGSRDFFKNASDSAEKDEARKTDKSHKTAAAQKKTKLKMSDVETKLSSGSSFVKDMVQAEADKQESDLELIGEKIHTKRSIRTYRRIVYSFVGLSAILILGVLYFTMISVKIVLVANQERMSNNLIFDIYDSGQEAQANGIPGVVKSLSVQKTMEYSSTGEEIIGKEAVGTVTIVNNYTKNQPLVATTRLVPVSDSEKLFRIKNTVNVPAGGSVEVEIYADEPSPEMAIAATKFTIPGLWAGLQDKIFASSNESIVYQQKVEKYLTEEDIDNAIRDLKQTMLSEAKNTAETEYSDYDKPLFKIDEDSISSSYEGEVGEKIDSFTMTMSAEVVLVAFQESSAIKMAEQKFSDNLPQSKEVVDFDKESMIYALNNFDLDKNTATVNATFEGKVSLTEDPNVIDVDNILGLSNDMLNNYLEGLSDVADFRVEYSPSFLPGFLKRVPSLKDRVEIEISK